MRTLSITKATLLDNAPALAWNFSNGYSILRSAKMLFHYEVREPSDKRTSTLSRKTGENLIKRLLELDAKKSKDTLIDDATHAVRKEFSMRGIFLSEDALDKINDFLIALVGA